MLHTKYTKRKKKYLVSRTIAKVTGTNNKRCDNQTCYIEKIYIIGDDSFTDN